jgi:hypothetical protein
MDEEDETCPDLVILGYVLRDDFRKQTLLVTAERWVMMFLNNFC